MSVMFSDILYINNGWLIKNAMQNAKNELITKEILIEKLKDRN